MARKNLVILIGLPITLLLVACGSQPKPVIEDQTPMTKEVAQVESANTPLPPTEIPIPPTEHPTGTPLPEIALDDLYGKWSITLFSMELHPDGTYFLLWPAEGEYEYPKEFGAYQLDYNIITFQPERYESTESPTLDGCHDGKAYTYTASFSEGDTRFLKLIEKGTDPCGWRARMWNAEPVWQQMEKYAVTVPDEAQLSMEDFIGRWDTPVAYIMFYKDGTWGSYETSAALEAGESYDGGTYLLKGNVLTLVSNSESSICPDSTGTYNITPGDGILTVDLVSDTCPDRGSTLADPDVKVWQRGS